MAPGELVDAVITEARARGLGYLIVHPSVRAYALYERLGFAETTSDSAHGSRRRFDDAARGVTL